MNVPTVDVDSLKLTSSRGVTRSCDLLSGTVTDHRGRRFPNETILQRIETRRSLTWKEITTFNQITGRVTITKQLSWWGQFLWRIGLIGTKMQLRKRPNNVTSNFVTL